ncbi:MAG: rubrerythrin-like domain-containing protein [Halodesulfurarchaeum sp.]
MPLGQYECFRCGWTMTDPTNRTCPECSGALRNRAQALE